MRRIGEAMKSLCRTYWIAAAVPAAKQEPYLVKVISILLAVNGLFAVIAFGQPLPPTITQLQNNYSFIQPGLPNYGIAPGSLFIIRGVGLGVPFPPILQSSSSPGLPESLNRTNVSVTVNGVTTVPSLYYPSATQLAAVLPSTTPVGTGTITVTYNGQTSAASP